MAAVTELISLSEYDNNRINPLTPTVAIWVQL